MLTSLFWGFSTNLWQALAARALAGAGNGNVGIIRTMVAELCPWKVSIGGWKKSRRHRLMLIL
jgi:MFS family permease